jgi:site-specific recombinase XerD
MSLFKRPGSPFWQTEIVVKGVRVVRSTGTSSSADAKKFERTLRDQLLRETAHPKRTPEFTLDQAAGRYWLEHGRRLRDARNVQRWLLYVTQYISKDLPLAELSTKHIVDMIAAMRQRAIGEISINRTVTALQGVHNRAGKSWEMDVKVINWRQLKTKERDRVQYLEDDQAMRLLAELPPHIRAVVLFLLATGLRKTEAFGLTWDKVKPSSVVVTVKGGYEREVKLGADAAEVLANQPREGAYVFDVTNYRKEFEAARVRAGVATIRWHDLRHTFATRLGKAGADLKVIKDALGHSSITVTEKYRHVTSSEVDEALARLPSMTTSPSGTVVALRRRRK